MLICLFLSLFISSGCPRYLSKLGELQQLAPHRDVKPVGSSSAVWAGGDLLPHGGKCKQGDGGCGSAWGGSGAAPTSLPVLLSLTCCPQDPPRPRAAAPGGADLHADRLCRVQHCEYLHGAAGCFPALEFLVSCIVSSDGICRSWDPFLSC